MANIGRIIRRITKSPKPSNRKKAIKALLGTEILSKEQAKKVISAIHNEIKYDADWPNHYATKAIYKIARKNPIAKDIAFDHLYNIAQNNSKKALNKTALKRLVRLAEKNLLSPNQIHQIIHLVKDDFIRHGYKKNFVKNSIEKLEIKSPEAKKQGLVAWLEIAMLSGQNISQENFKEAKKRLKNGHITSQDKFDALTEIHNRMEEPLQKIRKGDLKKEIIQKKILNILRPVDIASELSSESVKNFTHILKDEIITFTDWQDEIGGKILDEVYAGFKDLRGNITDQYLSIAKKGDNQTDRARAIKKLAKISSEDRALSREKASELLTITKNEVLENGEFSFDQGSKILKELGERFVSLQPRAYKALENIAMNGDKDAAEKAEKMLDTVQSWDPDKKKTIKDLEQYSQTGKNITPKIGPNTDQKRRA